MAVTLSTYGHFVAGTTPVDLTRSTTTITAQGSATTLVPPVNPIVTPNAQGPAYTIPVGATFDLYNGGTGTLTLAAGAGETYAGTATVAAAARIILIRTGATTWTGF